jgi:hypothetical protein
MLKIGDTVLRYKLIEELSRTADRMTWRAENEYGSQVLINTWEYLGAKPDAVQRALWSIELRNLFRLSSMPDAETYLTRIQNAGIIAPTPSSRGFFALALRVSGFRTLSDLLAERSKYSWLSGISADSVRASLWGHIRNIAVGLEKLHDCQMLHRAVSPSSIVVAADNSPSSMQLGGFEWTIRLNSSDVPTQLPVEFETTHSSFETDWFFFGTVLAQVFAAIDRSQCSESQASQLISRVRASSLTDREQQLIISLLAPQPVRLIRATEVLSEIDKIIDRLASPSSNVYRYLTMICLLGPQAKLTEAILDKIADLNFEVDITAADITKQLDFIRDDLRSPRVICLPDLNSYALKGELLTYKILPFENDEVSGSSWQLAYCREACEIRYSDPDEKQIDIENMRFAVFSVSMLRGAQRDILQQSTPWSDYLPTRKPAEKALRLNRFHEFFRVTNQIDVLMLDAQIFSYKRVMYKRENGIERCVVEEVDRKHPLYLKRFGMADMLSQQLEENEESRYVYLGEEPFLRLNRSVSSPEYWEVQQINEHDQIELSRVSTTGIGPPNEEGYLRTRGMFGQAHLVVRRNDAIARLAQHTYLLQSFMDPSLHYIDTHDDQLPDPLDKKEPGKIDLDTAKRDALKAIWRTRPLFALQGPPGTGKTTLVASLLRQIFADSEIAQVLVTAQAHPAVDVLRERVSAELAKSSDILRKPLSLRIPKPKDVRNPDGANNDPEYPKPLARGILDTARKKLLENKVESGISARWLSRIDRLLVEVAGSGTFGDGSEFIELVKRSANITYSSSTSAALVELSLSPGGFDWSINEEAGKAHGFDLVLPLQNAHRWLLIGDQNQLAPYRYQNFEEALDNIDSVFERLERLPRSGAIVDYNLIKNWAASTCEEKERKKKEWKKWLKIFAYVFEKCEQLKTDERQAKSTLSTMLWQQHRMHPVIGELVSRAFYIDPVTGVGRIKSMTTLENIPYEEGGIPLDRVTHRFEAPNEIRKCPIVWLDIDSLTGGKPSEEDHVGYYTSSIEVKAIQRFLYSLKASQGERYDLAVLSPYKPQVITLSASLSSLYNNPPGWLKPLKAGQYSASTVDSFQGNEADVVIVSLVRNNEQPMPKAFGFLRDRERMNVLLSRAEKMVVLVGSWSFFESNLRNVSEHDSEILSPWKRSINYLKDCFSNGSAVRIDAGKLPGYV